MEKERRRRQVREANRRYRARHRERWLAIRRRSELKCRYGITPEERTALLVAQGHKCASCKNPLTLGNVDHCHTSGMVRGIICHGCNIAIGHANDDPTRLRRMAAYLEKNMRLPRKVTR